MESFKDYVEEAHRRDVIKGIGSALGASGSIGKAIGDIAKKWIVIELGGSYETDDVYLASVEDMRKLQNPKEGIRPQFSDDKDIVVDMDSNIWGMKIFLKPGSKGYNEYAKSYKHQTGSSNLDNADLHDFDYSDVDLGSIYIKTANTVFKNFNWVKKQLDKLIEYETTGSRSLSRWMGILRSIKNMELTYTVDDWHDRELPANVKELFRDYLDAALEYAKEADDDEAEEEIEDKLEEYTDRPIQSPLGDYVGPRMHPVPHVVPESFKDYVEEAHRRDVIKGIGGALGIPKSIIKLPQSPDKQSTQKPIYLRFGWDFEIFDYGEATKDKLRGIQSPEKYRPVMSDSRDMVVDMDSMSPLDMEVILPPGTELYNAVITAISDAETTQGERGATGDSMSATQILNSLDIVGRNGLEIQNKIIEIYMKDIPWLNDQISRMTEWWGRNMAEDGDSPHKNALGGIQALRDLIEWNNGNRPKKRKLPESIITMLKDKYKEIRELAKATGDSESYQTSEEEIRELDQASSTSRKQLGDYVGPRMQPYSSVVPESFSQFYEDRASEEDSEEFEREPVSSQEAKPMTWLALASKLGVSEPTIYIWRKQDTAPTEPDEDQWREWMDARPMTWDALASKLGVPSSTLYAWSKVHKDTAPKERDEDQWREWLAAQLAAQPMTWDALASKLGVSSSTLYNLKKQDTAPTEPDEDQWREWMDARPMSWAALASKLGVSRSTLNTLKKQDTAPTEPDEDQWREWMDARPMSWSALASKLGLSSQTLYNLRSKHPRGSLRSKHKDTIPTEPDEEQWKRWMRMNTLDTTWVELCKRTHDDSCSRTTSSNWTRIMRRKWKNGDIDDMHPDVIMKLAGEGLFGNIEGKLANRMQEMKVILPILKKHKRQIWFSLPATGFAYERSLIPELQGSEITHFAIERDKSIYDNVLASARALTDQYDNYETVMPNKPTSLDNMFNEIYYQVGDPEDTTIRNRRHFRQSNVTWVDVDLVGPLIPSYVNQLERIYEALVPGGLLAYQFSIGRDSPKNLLATVLTTFEEDINKDPDIKKAIDVYIGKQTKATVKKNPKSMSGPGMKAQATKVGYTNYLRSLFGANINEGYEDDMAIIHGSDTVSDKPIVELKLYFMRKYFTRYVEINMPGASSIYTVFYKGSKSMFIRSIIQKQSSTIPESFKQFYEDTCNIRANELSAGDHIENINPECDHFRSKGIVVGFKTVPQDDDKTAGNIVVYKVTNNSSDFDEKDVNGTFSEDDELEKTEIQLKKIT
jgi:predicted DNA-binding transcriptional regulator AlpA